MIASGVDGDRRAARHPRGQSSALFRTLGPVNAIGIAVVLLAGLTLCRRSSAVLGREGVLAERSARSRRRKAPPRAPKAGGAPIGLRVRSRAGLYLGAALAFLLLACDRAHALGDRPQPDRAVPHREGRPRRASRSWSPAFHPGTVAPTAIARRPRDGTSASVRSRAGGEPRAARSRASARVVDTGRRSTDGRAALLNLIYVDDPFGPRSGRTHQGPCASSLAETGPGSRDHRRRRLSAIVSTFRIRQRGTRR